MHIIIYPSRFYSLRTQLIMKYFWKDGTECKDMVVQTKAMHRGYKQRSTFSFYVYTARDEQVYASLSGCAAARNLVGKTFFADDKKQYAATIITHYGTKFIPLAQGKEQNVYIPLYASKPGLPLAPSASSPAPPASVTVPSAPSPAPSASSSAPSAPVVAPSASSSAPSAPVVAPTASSSAPSAPTSAARVNDMDTLSEFIDACCEHDNEAYIVRGTFNRAYASWCRKYRKDPIENKERIRKPFWDKNGITVLKSGVFKLYGIRFNTAHKTSAPVVAPTASSSAPTASVVAPSASSSAPSASVVVPSAPVVAPSASSSAPSTPVVAPTASSSAPSASVVAPSASSSAPSAPVPTQDRMTLTSFEFIHHTPTGQKTPHANTNFGAYTFTFADGIKPDETQRVVNFFREEVRRGRLLLCTVGLKLSSERTNHLHVAFVTSRVRRNRYYNEKVKALFPAGRLAWVNGDRWDRNIVATQPVKAQPAAVWIASPIVEGLQSKNTGDFHNDQTRWFFAAPTTGIDVRDPVIQQQLAMACAHYQKKQKVRHDSVHRVTLENATECIMAFKATATDAADEGLVEVLTRMFFHDQPKYMFNKFFEPKVYKKILQQKLHVYANMITQDDFRKRVRQAIVDRVFGVRQPARKRRRT